MKTLTLETLIAKGACAASQEKFAKLFPNGAPLTVDTFWNVAGLFDWECAAKLLLTSHNRVQFNKSTAAEWAAYDDACATAFAVLYAQQENQTACHRP